MFELLFTIRFLFKIILNYYEIRKKTSFFTNMDSDTEGSE